VTGSKNLDIIHIGRWLGAQSLRNADPRTVPMDHIEPYGHQICNVPGHGVMRHTVQSRELNRRKCIVSRGPWRWGASGPVRAHAVLVNMEVPSRQCFGNTSRRCDLPNCAQRCVHVPEGIREDGARHVTLLPFRGGDTSQSLEGGCFRIE
jgi:hypothetical protein